MPKGNGDQLVLVRIKFSSHVRNTVNAERQWRRPHVRRERVVLLRQEHGEWREAMGTWQLLRNLKSESCLSETRWMARGNGDAAIAT